MVNAEQGWTRSHGMHGVLQPQAKVLGQPCSGNRSLELGKIRVILGDFRFSQRRAASIETLSTKIALHLSCVSTGRKFWAANSTETVLLQRSQYTSIVVDLGSTKTNERIKVLKVLSTRQACSRGRWDYVYRRRSKNKLPVHSCGRGTSMLVPSNLSRFYTVGAVPPLLLLFTIAGTSSSPFLFRGGSDCS